MIDIFAIFDQLITRPLGYLLNAIYGFTGSYGIALILFTFLLKIALFPVAVKTQKSTNAMSRLQPKIAEIQKKYKDDRQKMSQELQYLYEDEGVSPAGGCLPNLIQLPIIICLYSVINRPLSFMKGLAVEKIIEIGQFLNFDVAAKTLRQFEIPIAQAIRNNYDTVAAKFGALETIDFNFLGLNLAATPSIKEPSILWLIPIVSAITSFITGYITSKKTTVQSPQEGQAAAVGKAMLIYMPLISLWLGFTLPAGVGFYWTLSNVFTILQQQVVLKFFPPETVAVEQKGAKNKKK